VFLGTSSLNREHYPQIGPRASKGCEQKWLFVGKYHRLCVFNFAQFSGTLRVDRRFYLR
jgi:hypothetical protein